MSYEQPAAAGRRSVGLVVVLALHALLAYALVTGLARKVVEVIKAPLETKIIEEVKPPEAEPPPPPPPPKLAPPPPAFVPPPEVRVQTPVAPAETITTVTQAKPSEPVPIAQPAATSPVEAAPSGVADGPPRLVSTGEEPVYPMAARRAGESGTIRLAILVGVDGKVIELKVEQSTGSRSLDDSAKKWARLRTYKPAIRNGVPVEDWMRLEYEFKLE